jgi:hypothetical protein
MALVSGEDEFKYPCPHCSGYIVVIVQYYVEGGCYHTVEHRFYKKIDELERVGN